MLPGTVVRREMFASRNMKGKILAGNVIARQVAGAMHSLVSQNPYDISNDGFPGVQWVSRTCDVMCARFNFTFVQ